MKIRKAVFLSTLILSVILLGYWFVKCHQESYIKLFGLTKLISHRNSQGNLDGESVYYLNGQINIRGIFKNGKKDGLEERYFDDGKIKNRKYFKLGLADGKEIEYYANGKTRYSGNWSNNRKYGDLFYYYQNGALELYHCYDILGQKFFIIRKDSLGKTLKQEGSPFSSNIYQRTDTSTINILKQDAHLKDPNNLFVTVAAPPELNLEFFVKVNDQNVGELYIKENTLQIPSHYFTKGRFHLIVGGRFLDHNHNFVSNQILDMYFFID